MFCVLYSSRDIFAPSATVHISTDCKKNKKYNVTQSNGSYTQMQLSLSKKDVAQLHVMLSTLPIPPLPVLLKLDASKMSAGDTRTSFEMATVQIVKDAQCADTLVNSHSIIASMSFFSQWNSVNTTDECKKIMMHEKEAVILSLIKNVIEYSETCKKKCKSHDDKEIGDLFVQVSRAWIYCALPADVQLEIEVCPDFSTITYEHPLHVAMAHYCYSQGVLYSNKTSKLCCEVHSGFQEVYGNGPTRQSQEHLEIAEMYSTFSYVKLLNLCFNRLLKDSLYGHNYNEKEDVYQNAKDLLDLSVVNYNKVVNPISEPLFKISEINEIDSVVEETETVSCETIHVDEASNIISPETIPVAEVSDIISPETSPVAEVRDIISPETSPVAEVRDIISPETIHVDEVSNLISPETIHVHEVSNIISPETIPVLGASNITSPETIPVAEVCDIISPGNNHVLEASNIISDETIPVAEVIKVVTAYKEPQETSNIEKIQESGTFDVLLGLLLKSEEPMPESEMEKSVSKTPGIAENSHKSDGDDILVIEGPLRPHETRKSLSDLVSTHDTTNQNFANLENHIVRTEKTDENIEVLVTQYSDEEANNDNCSTMTNCSNNEPSAHNLDIIQMLSYKSAAGIFVMEIINFIRNENMYSYDNMRTNLRHILELLTIDDEIVNEACSIINIPNLIHLVKTYISNSGDSAKCPEIFLIIEDIENITKGKKKH